DRHLSGTTRPTHREAAFRLKGNLWSGVRDRIRDRALTLLLLAMFLVFLAGQLITGLAEHNAEQREHGQPAFSMSDYLHTGHPWEAIFENWESEFLQMAVFVILTTFLIQKGS